jgi:hypothetical protein
METDPAFVATLPYRPEAYLIDEIVEVDREGRRLRARLCTAKALPLLDLQKTSAIHPPHLPGGLIVHLTGMLGCTHAHYVHGVRFDEGWIGYGSRIHRADFKRLVRVGPDLDLDCLEVKGRRGPERHVVRYEFRFTQEGALCYYGEQTAMWLRGGAAVALASGAAGATDAD